MAELDALFRQAVENNASDIHLSPGEPYIIRKFGSLQKLQDDIISADRSKQLVNELLDQNQQTKLLNDLQLDFDKFKNIGVIHQDAFENTEKLDQALQAIEKIRQSSQWIKKDIIDAIKIIVPELDHIEKNKNLDEKM